MQGNLGLRQPGAKPQASRPASPLEVELRTANGYIQWRYQGFIQWNNLTALSDLTGPTGKQGPQGIPGVQGPKGDQGIQGEKGTQGIPGAPGLDGTPGATGTIGATGAKGSTGANGSDGLAGKDGADGTEIELRVYGGFIQWRYLNTGKWTNLVALADLKGANGKDGAKGDKGDTGATGKEGEDGEQGQRGPTGPQGSPGAKGDKGDKGDPGTGGGAQLAVNEVPTDVGSHRYDTAFEFMPGTVAVYINGLRQLLGVDYTETTSTRITVTSMFVGAIITVDYEKA